jgi:hypothetical protein
MDLPVYLKDPPPYSFFIANPLTKGRFGPDF